MFRLRLCPIPVSPSARPPILRHWRADEWLGLVGLEFWSPQRGNKNHKKKKPFLERKQDYSPMVQDAMDWFTQESLFTTWKPPLHCLLWCSVHQSWTINVRSPLVFNTDLTNGLVAMVRWWQWNKRDITELFLTPHSRYSENCLLHSDNRGDMEQEVENLLRWSHCCSFQ